MKLSFKSSIILIFSFIVMVLIVSASYLNFKAIQDNVIQTEQLQLLSQAETLATSVENYFMNQRHNLEILTKNRNFINDLDMIMNSEIPEEIKNSKFQNLVDYFVIQSGNIDVISVVDLEGNEIFAYPSPDYGEGIHNDIEGALASKTSTTGEIYDENGKLYINVLYPVVDKETVAACLYVKIKLDTIYYSLVAPVKAGEKGYASVKDSDGILIMHPNTKGIGEDIIAARTGEYPDFDWSELEVLVEKQKRGESGVGIYHSLWFTDDAQKRVLKFSAYAPAFIGGDFWIINISKDYNEVTSFLKQRTMNIIGVNIFIIILYVTILMYLYRIKKDRDIIEKEREHMMEVSLLNEELEADIAKRIVLERELLTSKNKFENIFQSGSDCIFVISTSDSGQIVEVNDKVMRSLGFTKTELLSKRYFDISSVMDRPYLEKLTQDLKNRQNVMFEDLLLGAKDITIPVEINMRKLADDMSDQLVMISRDITMKKKFEAESEENKKREALMIYQSRLAAMGEMIGSIAHQWRQPLSGISMIFNNLEDAYRYGELDDVYLNQQGKRMQELVKYMSQTIDDFRFFFNPNNDTEDFLISNVIDKTLEFLKESIRLNNIEIIYEMDQDALLNGRPNQLSQVIFSILKNAIDVIMIEGAENRKIWIRIHKMHHGLTLEIEDSGGGTPQNQLDKIFDAYFTTKERHNGTGLGLYISKVIVEKNFSGKIMAKNTDLGLCITIDLPYLPSE